MNERLLTSCLTLAWLSLIVTKSYACNQPPVAIIADPYTKWAHVDNGVNLDGSDSYDPEGNFFYWHWDFGDGTSDSGYWSPPPEDLLHTYSACGTYYTTLTVHEYGEPWESGSDNCQVHVIELSLTAGSDYVTVNDDDDNNNGTPDNDPSETTVTGENDLVAIHLSVQPNNLSGEVELKDWSASEYLGAIKVWRYADKREQVIPDPSTGSRWKRWSPAALPQNLYVEGIGYTSLDQARLALNYYAPSWGQVALPPGIGRVQLTVVKVDLDMSGVDDSYEQNPGGYVGLNDDDDNNNGTADKDDPGTVAGENDLVEITLQQVLPTDLTGSVTLKAIAGGSKIKVWTDSTKGGSPISLPKTYQTPSQLPKSLWIEGFEASSSLRDVTLALEYTVGGHTFDDKIKITVFDVTLTKIPTWWMPQGGSEDNVVQETATISPSDLTGVIKFTVYDASNEPGYCLNRPATIPGSGQDSASWKDLQFEDPQSGLTITGSNKDVATTTGPVNMVSVWVYSYDYGAYGKIKAEAQINGQWFTADAENEVQQFVRIPQDNILSNQKYISVGWQYHGAYDSDDDTSLNNSYNGDGLIGYEEYRGVDIDGDGKVSDSERLNPNRKDLFVQGSGFGGDFPDFAYGSAFSEAEINVHDFVGTVGTDDRNIDVLVVTAVNSGYGGSEGHIGRSGDPLPSGVRFWHWNAHGSSNIGTGTSYGSPSIYKKAVNYHFSDKPHLDNNTWTAPGVWGGAANGVLDPVNPEKVEDTNDNGVLEANEKDGNTSAPHDDGDNDFDGDYPVKDSPWEWNHDLSPHDIDNDGLIELPMYAQVPVSSDDEYTKAQVVRHTITHEMGHGAGIYGSYGGHCNDSTCVMYQYPNNWKRDGHFCNDCRGMVRIHNN